MLQLGFKYDFYHLIGRLRRDKGSRRGVQNGYLEEDTESDYELLAGFRYRSHSVGIVRKIFRVVRGAEVVGVIVYCYPGMTVADALEFCRK
jgi:hypothetical protein